MTWLSVQATILLLALVTASTQCLARCIGEPCHGANLSSQTRNAPHESKTPPCHGEKPKNEKPPAPPSQLSVLAESRASATAAAQIGQPGHFFALLTSALQVPGFTPLRDLLLAQTSPAGATDLVRSPIL